MKASLVRRVSLVLFVVVSFLTPLAVSSPAAADGPAMPPSGQCKEVVCG